MMIIKSASQAIKYKNEIIKKSNEKETNENKYK